MSLFENYKNSLIKALLAAGIAGVSSIVFYDDSFSNKIPLGMFSVASPIAIGGAVASASLLTDVVHIKVLPYLPGAAKYSGVEGMLLGVGVSGLGTIGVLRLMGAEGGEWESFMLGGGSYAAADYLSGKVSTMVM